MYNSAIQACIKEQIILFFLNDLILCFTLYTSIYSSKIPVLLDNKNIV